MRNQNAHADQSAAVAAVLLNGRFVVGEKLSDGWLGAVYDGIDQPTGARLRVRELRRGGLLLEPREIARYQAELARLRQQNIPHLHLPLAFSQHADVYYLVNTYHAGSNAAPPKNGWPWRTVIEIGLVVAGVLSDMHAVGLLHRAIRPSNILVCEDGTLLIADPCLPRLSHYPHAVYSGVVLTDDPLYTSPEQMAGRPLTVHTDLWQFGVCLHEMLLGQHPLAQFEPVNSAQRYISLGDAILKAKIPPLAPQTADVPQGLCGLVNQMLLCEPTQRPQSAAEVAERLTIISGSS